LNRPVAALNTHDGLIHAADPPDGGALTIGETPAPAIVAPGAFTENDAPDPVRSAPDMNE
jgi:hypothetical protein